MILFSLLIGFIFTPLDGTEVYMDTNGFTSLNFELYNNGYFNATYNLIIKRISLPEDVTFQMCFHNQCFVGDSQAITVVAGTRDTITLDLISGNQTGPIHIYYLVYDQNSPQDRDSVEITGGVPVYETKSEDRINITDNYIYGKNIINATIFSQDGRVIKEMMPNNNRIYTGFLKRGIYFILINRGFNEKIFKFFKE